MLAEGPGTEIHSKGDRPATLSPLLQPIDFDDLPGWRDDDHAAALACFLISARRMAKRAYTTKALGIDGTALRDVARQALTLEPTVLADPQMARNFFERHFAPHRIVLASGKSGFVTGYFEPELTASPVRTERFTYPLYRRPPDLVDIDLVDIDDASRPAGMDSDFRFARRLPDGTLKEYFDRESIEAGALSGQGLELAWLENPVDGFFVHIQGSARLTMTDGSVKRIAYAGKSGHPFTPIGRLLIETGELASDEVTMATIRDWLLANPERGRRLMNRNRSFIFFAETAQSDPSSESPLGPVAAASVPLSAGRSIALDHQLHTFGTPVWIATDTPLPEDATPFRRLMINQDTGSAITGPARGDLFIGSGERAGEIAGAIKHQANFAILVPHAIGSAGN